MLHPLAGKKQTPEHIAKRAAALRGFRPSDEHRAKIGAANKIANKGKVRTPEMREHYRQARRKRADYKGSISSNALERDRFRKELQQKIFERDDYTCQVCDKRGNDLHADHIKSWKDYPDLRFDISNCRTLCRPCHYYVTFKKSMPDNSKWGLFWAYRAEKIR